MTDIQIQIDSDRPVHRAVGVVTEGGVERFRCVAQYDPKNTGIRVSYPWVVSITNTDAVLQRFTTYDGALAEVKALTLRQFDLAVQEQSRARVNEELQEMVEEICR